MQISPSAPIVKIGIAGNASKTDGIVMVVQPISSVVSPLIISCVFFLANISLVLPTKIPTGLAPITDHVTGQLVAPFQIARYPRGTWATGRFREAYARDVMTRCGSQS